MNTNNLMTTDDIAKLVGVTRATATNRIVKRPGFPAPVINLSQRTKRWSTDDVLKYLKSGRRSPKPSPGSTPQEVAADLDAH